MINLPVDKNILYTAIDKWGNTAQLFVAIEECGEFIQAAMKFENRGRPIDNLMDETADLLFLMLQMRQILGEDEIDRRLLNTQEKLKAKLDNS